MEGSASGMRSSNPHLGEMTIKVPAPFAGITDLGLTVQYRAQSFNEPMHDVPLVFEGPTPPLQRLAEMLQLLSGGHSSAYAWTPAVMLSDEVIVLAFRDRSVASRELSDGAGLPDYVLNLVQPVVFTFLRDCAKLARLKLSDVIEMRVSAQRESVAEIKLPVEDIVQPNGERLLWGLAS